MKINIKILVLFIFVGILNIYAITDKKYTVVTKNAQIYDTTTSKLSIGTVPFGMPLKSIKNQNNRVEFEYQGKKNWIDIKDIREIDFSIFTTSSRFFIPSTVVKDSCMWFIYKNQMYVLNLTNLDKPKFSSISKIPNISDAVPSPNRNFWILLGEVSNPTNNSLNVGLFSVDRKKFSELTSFFGPDVTIESIEFSPNEQFAAFFMNINEKNYIYVFDLKTLSLIFTDQNAIGFSWYQDRFLVYYDKSISLYEINSWKKILLQEVPPIVQAPISAFIGNQLLISINDSIYQFSDDKLLKTSYKSLERSENGLLEQYRKNNTTILTYKGQRIYNLSGQKPRWAFDSFLGDHFILYKEQKGAIATIYRYNAENKESVPYYWVEDTENILSDGSIVDVIVDGEEIWIIIESPNKKAKMLQLNELL